MLGFPLREKNDSYTEFIFISWLEFLRFFIIALLPFSGIIYLLIVILVVDGNFDNLESVINGSQEKYTTSKMDSIASSLWGLVIVPVTWFVYVVLFKRNVSSINKFCNDVSKIKSTMNAMLVKKDEERKQRRLFTCGVGEVETSQKMLIYGQILSIILSCMYGSWAYINSPFLRFGSHIGATYACFVVIQMLLVAFGPISAATEVIICQVITSLIDLFQEWEEILENSPNLHTVKCSSKEKTDTTNNSLTKPKLYEA
jgi:hypothetical protein